MDDSTIRIQGNVETFVGRRLLVGITYKSESGQLAMTWVWTGPLRPQYLN